MATHTKTFFTPEQYLELEEQAEYKSEYLDGQILAMAGGTEAHSLIAMHIGRDLDQQIRQRLWAGVQLRYASAC